MVITSKSAKCLLMGLDGVTYQALLGDVSSNGASLRMSDAISHGLHVGEMCGLILRDSPDVPSTKYTGRIISLDSGNVGISFRQQAHQHQKKKYH